MKVLPRFPPAFDYDAPVAGAAAEFCPFSTTEMEEYLYESHYHVTLKEEPTRFVVMGLLCEVQDKGRHYWLYDARDRLERRWFVSIGSGRSPIAADEWMWRWMFAQDDSGVTPEEYLREVVRDQLEHDRVQSDTRVAGDRRISSNRGRLE